MDNLKIPSYQEIYQIVSPRDSMIFFPGLHRQPTFRAVGFYNL